MRAAVLCKCGAFLAREFFETITNIAERMNELRMARIFFNLSSQGSDAAIDTARCDHHGIAPNGVQDVIPRQGAPLAEKEILQKPKLLGREVHFLTIAK